MKPAPSADLMRQAFELLAVRSADLRHMTFDQAMANEVWARVIDLRARAMRTTQYQATTTRRVRHVRRVHPVTGAWVTQVVPGEFDESQPRFPV